jgi:hypothetical protein
MILSIRQTEEGNMVIHYSVIHLQSFDKLESNLHWQRVRHASPNNRGLSA